VLIVDDMPVVRLAERALRPVGFECVACVNGQDALSSLAQDGGDALLADLTLLGHERFAEVRSRFPELPLIVFTFNPGVGSALAAMRQGAFDYLVKPLDEGELRAIVCRAIEISRLRRENDQLRRQLDMAATASSFIAESPAGKQLLAMVRRIAPTGSIVLIEGESGTGKELVARMLHYWSDRSQGPFVVLNCKGSAAALRFGQSIQSGSGWPHDSIPLQQAEGGTLFIDEIGEANPTLQAEFVRVIDQAEAEAAANPDREPGVRIVAATSRSLKSEMEAGRFRADLFFRLSAIPVRIPPLRERREDILLLARRFLASCAVRIGRRLSLTSDAERELLLYRWPGNVRELRNVIERAAMLTGADFVPSKSLELGSRAEAEPSERLPVTHIDGKGAHPEMPSGPQPSATESSVSPPSPGMPTAVAAPAVAPPAAAGAAPTEPAAEHQAVSAVESGSLQECLDKAARVRIKAALDAAAGNRADAAKALDVDGPTLGRLIRRLGL
jgi:DNA-binding NtrC family response regulator